jgi:ribosomal protein S18 acetylase RimI-like enzyme
VSPARPFLSDGRQRGRSRVGGSTDVLRARSGRLRLRDWPGDPTVGHLLVTDHDTVPSARELDDFVIAARDHGYRAVRSGALFPRAHESFAACGFETIDTLVLLELGLSGVVVELPRRRTARLLPWQHSAAAEVDRAAFGAPWGNDAATLGDIRRATPQHRARRIDVDGTLQAFAITGAAGRTGYLQRLAVHPDHQRSGLGSALVVDSLSWMRRRALTTAMVNTGVHNHPAQRLYDDFGFRRLAEQLTIVELTVAPGPGPA